MGLKAQDGVAHIIVMGDLDLIEQDHVFKFCGVSHHSALTHQGIAPQEGTVAHLRIFPDDDIFSQIGTFKNPGRFMDPDSLTAFFIFAFRQTVPQLQDKIPDPGKGLPGVLTLLQ